MKKNVLRTLLLASLVLLVSSLVACRGESSGSADNRFAGKVSGGDAYAYVQRDGDFVNAYVSNGTQDPYSASIVGWFSGDIDTATNEFHGISDTGLRLVVQFHDRSVSGKVSLENGTDLNFSLPQEGGFLYRALGVVDGFDYEAGWIVLSDNTQRGGVLYGKEPNRFPAVVTPLFATISNTATIASPRDGNVAIVAEGDQMLSAF